MDVNIHSPLREPAASEADFKVDLLVHSLQLDTFCKQEQSHVIFVLIEYCDFLVYRLRLKFSVFGSLHIFFRSRTVPLQGQEKSSPCLT